MGIFRTFSTSSSPLLSIAGVSAYGRRKMCASVVSMRSCCCHSPILFLEEFFLSCRLLAYVFHMPFWLRECCIPLVENFFISNSLSSDKFAEKNQALAQEQPHTHALSMLAIAVYSSRIHQQHIHILWNRKRARFAQALSCNALQ